ncbi:MAG: FliM/FliN family flagellar motor switch protein [Maritimibacter sp.]
MAELVAQVGNVEETRITLDPFIEALPDPCLLGLIEGPEGRFGMVILDAQSIAALIEIQTTGRVIERAAEARAPTRTDAVMCADFIDKMLELIEVNAAEAELEVAPAITGYRYAMALADTRAITMTLENMPYRRFEFSVDFALGAKSGVVQILMPFDPPGVKHDSSAEDAAFTGALQQQVMDAEVTLSTTLLRRELTVAEVAEFTIGTLIPVPREALSEITVEGTDGTVVGKGRLGQVGGFRAVRLCGDDMAAAPPAAMSGAMAGGMSDVMDMSADMPAMLDAPAGGLGDLAALGGDLPSGDGLADLGSMGGDAGGLGDLGGLGELGGADPVADLGSLGDLGDLGGTGGADLGDLGSLGDLGGAGNGLGDLGDLGSLGGDASGGMPDLGELPDLASLGS